jgi:hypothetical protein
LENFRFQLPILFLIEISFSFFTFFRLKEKKPGELTDDLRTALGMPVGPNAHKVPPPWLIAMQRYGPPPSYPNLKIPGLNAAIPEGCSFGYHAGGWGELTGYLKCFVVIFSDNLTYCLVGQEKYFKLLVVNTVNHFAVVSKLT